MAFRLRTLALNLPFGLGGIEIDVNQEEARAAWNLYVELATRIAVQPLAAGQGSAREALTSVYQVFGVTREVLRTAGPAIAAGPDHLGPVAIRILNEGLRPFLTRWHTSLTRFEAAQTGTYSDADWPERPVFDRELAAVQAQMAEYLTILAEIAGVTA